MCGIACVVGHAIKGDIADLLIANTRHGRDGYGSVTWPKGQPIGVDFKTPGIQCTAGYNMVGDERDAMRRSPGFLSMFNCRAEPTTEIIDAPVNDDQQPYVCGKWTIVHNGVIANDMELTDEFGLQPPTIIDSWVIAGLLEAYETNCDPGEDPIDIFAAVINRLKGSWAIIAKHQDVHDRLYYATNYRPLYVHKTPFAMAVTAVPVSSDNPMIEPYTIGYITQIGVNPVVRTRVGRTRVPRSLVVLSGGLDSTCVLAELKQLGHDVEAIHFDYGCRATGNERHAVEQICLRLDVKLNVITTDIFRTLGHSRLIGDATPIDNGEAGAEQAIEWVPARNIIMSSIAIGYAEAHSFDHVALGINLEESGGGYTDNVLDLYRLLNTGMHWMIGVDKNLSFISPVGNMMKHEIVALGLSNNAPFELTWSCYNQGDVHCGNCGPCIMRRRAFGIAGCVDPVQFACE